MRSHETATPIASAVKRAFEILECLGKARRGLNISEISRRLNIPKSSAHVIVLTLERLGYIERQSQGFRYSLGFKTRLPGHEKALALSSMAQSHMRLLAEDLNLPASLAIPDDTQGVLIQKVDPPNAIRFDNYVGQKIDLHSTAAGKVILAFGGNEIRDTILGKATYIPRTPNTITHSRLLARELRQVKRLAYAFEDEEDQIGVRSVAVPVAVEYGRFVGSLGVTGAIAQITSATLGTIVASLRKTAANIAAEKLQPIEREIS